MKTKILLTLFAILFASGEPALAQFPYGGYGQPGYGQPGFGTPKPAVSPYINLLRNGNSPGFNYLTLVRPQLAFQQGIQGLQSQVNTVQQSIAAEQSAQQAGPVPLPATGHAVGFMTHHQFFMTSGAGAAGTAPVVGPKNVQLGSQIKKK